MCCCEWKTTVGFAFHLIVWLFAIFTIILAVAKPGSDCPHIPDQKLHVYLYFASATAMLASFIHLIAMCKFIGVKDDAYDDADDSVKRKANKNYLILSIVVLVPNLGWLVYGLIVLIGAKSPAPSHETVGKGGITNDDYCYRGLWLTLHMDLICSAVLMSVAVMIFAVVTYQLKSKTTTAWHASTLPRRKQNRQESSWNGNGSGFSQKNQRQPPKYRQPPSTEPLIVGKKVNSQKEPKMTKTTKPKKVNTIRGFTRAEQHRNSAKWHTPRRQDMNKPNFDPYGAIDV